MKQINIAEPSIKSLLIEMRFNSIALATGTAFVVNAPRGPVLVTNRHNVTGRNQKSNQPLSSTGGVPNEIRILHNKLGRIGEWISVTEQLYSGSQPLWIEHPTFGPKADLVALPLSQLSDVALYPYALGTDNPDVGITPAEVVSVVGFPFGMTGGGALAIWATGFVASEPDINYDGLPIFLIDCRSRQGQSGSAVIAHRSGFSRNKEGKVRISNGTTTSFLGIYSGRVNAESDLGFVWKEQVVKELADSII